MGSVKRESMAGIRLYTGLFLFSAFFCVRSAAGDANETTSHVVVTSDVIVPDTEFAVFIQVDRPKVPVKEHSNLIIGIEIQDLVLFQDVWTLDLKQIGTPTYSRTFQVLIPSDKKLLKKIHKVVVKSQGDVEFDYKVELPVEWKNISLSITSDKLHYEPGNTVEIFVLSEHLDLKPFAGPLNVSIYDSRNFALVRWIEEIPDNGVIRHQYRLPLVQKPGELILSVENHEQVVNETIQVEEPGCIPFLVELQASKYHSIHVSDSQQNKNFTIPIVANHISGAPLYGAANATVRLQSDEKWFHLESVRILQGYGEVSVNPNELKKILGLSGEESLLNKSIEVSVSVLEVPAPHPRDKALRQRALGQVIKNVNITFLDQSYVLTFHEFTPKAFKPGLLFVGYVELKSVKEFAFESKEVELTVNVYHYKSESEKPSSVEDLKVLMIPNSVGQFNFTVPSDDVRIDLEAVFVDKESGKVVKARLDKLQPFKTKKGGNHAIQVLLDQERPRVKIGHSLKVKIESTFPIDKLTYNVFSESVLVLPGEICSSKASKSHELSLNIPRNVSHLLSSPRLVVWTETPGNEIVADSILFLVEHEEEKNKVKISLSSHFVEIGGSLEITVKTEPYSEVRAFVMEDLPVFDADHSVVSERIAREKMRRKLLRLKSSYVKYLLETSCRNCTTIPDSDIDSAKIFNESKAFILTDEILYQDRVNLEFPDNGTWGDLELTQLDAVDNLKSACWRALEIKSNGKASFRLSGFDKSALYTFSVIAISPGNKVVVAEEPIQVTIGSRILSSISHPEEILRGEEFLVEVTIFNNNTLESEVNASIAENKGMKLLCQESKVQNVKIGPRQQATVQFFVKSTMEASTELDIEVNLGSNSIRQRFESTVRVTLEEMEVQDDKTWVLDNFKGNEHLEIDVKQPIKKAILNTEQAEVKIYGDLLGPVIERVCREDQSTSLLEDRTKLNFVQTLHVIRHLANNPIFESVPKTGGSIVERDEVNGSFNVHVNREKCIKSGLEYIQNLLNKQYPGGYYSFHPGSTGYLWLTSMMLDSMVDLAKVQPRYNDEAGRATRWLMSRQKKDGSYVEEKGVLSLRVHNLKDIPLTAQVMSSLIRAKEHLPLETQDVKLIEASVSKSVKFLEEALATKEVTNDSYVLAIGSYALVLARSQKVHEVLEKRDKLVIAEGGTLHWRVAEYDDNSSLSVEATAYAALTYLEMGGLHESRPIIDWLISQMTYEGAFVYVEDTSIALRALTLYSRLLQEQHDHQSINVDVELTTSNDEKTVLKIVHPLFAGSISFDHTNMSLGCPLKIETSGSGLILIQSITRYNTPIPSENSERVSLSVDTKNVDSHLEVKVCTGSLKHFESGFSVVEVPFLSSYKFDLKRNKERNDKVESYQIFADDRTAWIIIDKLSPEPLCLDLEFEQVNIIGHRQPRPIRSYALIEPSKAAVKPYADVNKESEDKVCPW